MATFAFNNYLDELSVDAANWLATQFSSTKITLEGAEFRVELSGSGFSVGSSTGATGTITGVKVYGYDYATGAAVETLAVSGSGLSHSLAGFVNAMQNGDYGGVDYLLNGNDSLTGSSGDDEISGFAGNDTLNGGAGNDELNGDTWDWGGSSAVGGTDTLYGGAGSDELNGGAGADTMYGGTGDDFYIVDNAGDKVIENAGEGSRDRVEFNNGAGLMSYTLTANVENLTVAHWSSSDNTTAMTARGNDLANKISVDSYYDAGLKENLYGMGGNDRLFAGAGNDLLDGGTGNDIMIGGFGSDLYYVDSNLDKVVEEVVPDPENTDIDTVVYTVATSGSTASLGGTVSGLTNSILLAQIENLTLGASTASTTLLNGVGSDGANKLIGNAAVNKLYGLAGNDMLYGYAGNDTLDGGAGNDTLDGGAGADTMTGGLGNDTYYVDNASDAVIESSDATYGGIDTVIASVTRTLGSYQENLTLSGSLAINGYGNELANKLTGNAMANILSGGIGNDVLTGGAGKDTLTGGAGNDVFDFNALTDTGLDSTTWDVITDFARGYDKIDLSTLDANTATATNDAFTSVIGSATAFSAAGQLKVVNGVLYGNTDADSTAEFAIQLTGVTALTTADFVL